MRRKRSRSPQLWLLMLGFGLVLACNAPVHLARSGETIPPPPAFDASPVPTAVATTMATLPPQTDAPTRLPLPTFTPPSSRNDPSVVETAPSPQAEPTPAVAATETPQQYGAGPLGFTYQLSWEIDSQDGSHAIATVRLFPYGGNGQYQFFHDDLPQPEAVFTYRWIVCRANPGSLRVDSDGESIRVDYFEQPPCPNS